MTWLQLELACWAGSAEEFAGHATSWFTDARTELFPELSRHLPDTAVLRKQTGDPAAAVGPPGATWANINVYREATALRGTKAELYKPSGWRRVLDTLASEYPFNVSLTMMPLDTAGRLIDSRAAVSVLARRDYDDPRWVRFIINAQADLISWPHPPGIEEEWVRFLERWADRLGACYGHITDDASVTNGTALEMATQTPGIDPPTVPRCHEVLRGYSWVTICAPELARRLGGVPALTASGAFHEVRELAGGQVLLRATPLLEQYEGAAVERVFRVLAPVLLPGRADPKRAPVGGRLMLGADAADYQR
jgi:hypothetical protein